MAERISISKIFDVTIIVLVKTALVLLLVLVCCFKIEGYKQLPTGGIKWYLERHKAHDALWRSWQINRPISRYIFKHL